MKRVVVMGGSGLIGRHCVERLVALGYEVHSAQRSCLGQPNAHQANLLDPQQIQALFRSIRPTHLLHLAWYMEPGLHWTSMENVSYVEASVRLLRDFAAVGGRRAVIAGTCAEYVQRPGIECCHEFKTPIRPATLYGAAKAALFILQDRICPELGISSAWARIFQVYGPYERPMRFVPSLTSSLLSGEPAICLRPGAVCDFIHAADVASGLVCVLESDYRGPVNIGSGEGVALGEVANLVGQLAGRPDLIRFKSDASNPSRVCADNLILRSLGFVPTLSLSEGLAAVIEWWRCRLGEATLIPR